MKIALYSLPRSRSEVLFNYLEPMALMLGMEVYRPKNGQYYYIDNSVILENTFLKIDSRTNSNFLKTIVSQFSSYHWFITTREFEEFCLSLSYARQVNKFHDTSQETSYNTFEISYNDYTYTRDLYQAHIDNIAMITHLADSVSVIDYKDSIVNNSATTHIEKDYKVLCSNYAQFRDWQRIDYILSQNSTRKWNCWSSHHTGTSLHTHELFNDIVNESDCNMWYNVYDNGDSQDWHTHDGVDSCGTRFLQIPNNSGLFEFSSSKIANLQHTQINFLPTDLHRVTTHNNTIPRITVSWNVKNKY
tara:strand:- start:3398 stop:4306 length:909 start_codon:yes stop_codon:yes gene_type:complete